MTLPTEQAAAPRKPTDDVCGHVAEAVARQLRHQLLGAGPPHHQQEYGAFTEEEPAKARSRIFGIRVERRALHPAPHRGPPPVGRSPYPGCNNDRRGA